MARKSETGIEYFPINSDIIHNPKIKLVVAEFGSKTTWAVLLPLYCKIYREKGYWVDWHDDDSKMLFALDECKIELSVVNEFVNGCIRRSIFDKGVFDMFGVLTSDRIQENYLTAKARNLNVSFIEEFALKNEKKEFVYKFFKNVNIIDLDVHIIKKKVDVGTQRKKEKKIIEGEGEGEVPHPLKGSNLFRQPVIPTKQSVLEAFVQRSGTKEMAKKFYENNESVGWFYKGSPITNFVNLVPGFISAWKSYDKDKTPVNNTEPGALSNTILEIEQQEKNRQNGLN